MPRDIIYVTEHCILCPYESRFIFSADEEEVLPVGTEVGPYSRDIPCICDNCIKLGYDFDMVDKERIR